MKKALSLILTLIMLLSLVACTGGNAPTPSGGAAPVEPGKPAETSVSAEPTKMTLILRGGSYAETLKAALPAFEAEHNVKIDVLDLSFDDLHTGIALDAVNATGAYDLCMVDGSWMAACGARCHPLPAGQPHRRDRPEGRRLGDRGPRPARHAVPSGRGASAPTGTTTRHRGLS